jgi:hypothetical protein
MACKGQGFDDAASKRPATAPRVAERGMCALRPWVSTCGDMMKRSAAVGDLRPRRSLHTAEATGWEPVTPTSTNASLRLAHRTATVVR